MDLPRAHATLVVALDGPDGALPPRIRTFLLRDVEREPEPHLTTPLGTPADVGTRPATASAVHGHWVEVAPDKRRADPRPRGVLVGRGPVGDLLAQEFLDTYIEREALLVLQAVVDKLRSASDATRWTATERARIEQAQRTLEDAFYGARFPHRVVLTALTRRFRDALKEDLKALDAPRALFVDAVDP